MYSIDGFVPHRRIKMVEVSEDYNHLINLFDLFSWVGLVKKI